MIHPRHIIRPIPAATAAALLSAPAPFDLGRVAQQYVHVPRAVERKPANAFKFLPLIGGCCCSCKFSYSSTCSDKTPRTAFISASGMSVIASYCNSTACVAKTIKFSWSGSVQAVSGCVTCNQGVNSNAWGCNANNQIPAISDLFTGAYGAQAVSSCSVSVSPGSTYAGLSSVSSGGTTTWKLVIWISSDLTVLNTTGAMIFRGTTTTTAPTTCKGLTLSFSNAITSTGVCDTTQAIVCGSPNGGSMVASATGGSATAVLNGC